MQGQQQIACVFQVEHEKTGTIMNSAVFMPLVHPRPETAFQMAVDWAERRALENAMSHRINQDAESREKMSGWKLEELTATLLCFQLIPWDGRNLDS